MEPQASELGNRRWIEDWHPGRDKAKVLLKGHRGRLGLVVLTREDDDRSRSTRAGEVRMLEGVARSVEPGTLAVPESGHADIPTVRVVVEHLRTHKRRDRLFFVSGGEVNQIELVECRTGLGQLPVVAAERAARVAADECAGAQAGRTISAGLFHR